MWFNIPRWRTNRKIVVFESDDWGSIRMPSISVLQELRAFGIPVDKSPYCRFDALESNTGELKCYFKDGENAVVVEANDIDAISKGIVTILTNKEFTDNIAKNAKKLAANEFYYKKSAVKLDNFIRGLKGKY
jgi:glycosyltransferase involved in cell wall biosynthesis